MAALQIMTRLAGIPDDLRARLKSYSPKSNLGAIAKECFAYLPPHLAGELLESLLGCVVMESSLEATVIRHPDSAWREGKPRTLAGWRANDQLHVSHDRLSAALRAGNTREAHRLELQVFQLSQQARLLEHYGVVSRRVITNNGVAALVDAYQNTVEPETFKYHGIGTGTNAESASDTALQTELTTEYNPNSTRATGTLAETSSNIFQTVATNTLDSGTPAVTEHVVISQAATGGGTGALY